MLISYSEIDVEENNSALESILSFYEITRLFSNCFDFSDCKLFKTDFLDLNT